MARFEITLTAETWTVKTHLSGGAPLPFSLDEEPFKQAMLALHLDEVEVDLDEIDHTDMNTQWEISVTAEFECANGEEDAIAKEAGDALKAAGLVNITWDMEEEDYPMPEHEILEVFRDTVLPNIKHKNDRIAKWEAFQFHVDSLQKRGMITEWQSEHIDNPWSRSMP